MCFRKRKKVDGPGSTEGMQKVCPNCRNPWREGDKYCRYCGSPMTAPSYIEFEMTCIYGPPPVERKHVCQSCGYTWTTCAMLDRERRCPKCGGDAPVSEETALLDEPTER